MKRLGGEIMDARIYWVRPIYLAMETIASGRYRVRLWSLLMTASVVNANLLTKSCIMNDLVDAIAFPGWEDGR